MMIFYINYRPQYFSLFALFTIYRPLLLSAALLKRRHGSVCIVVAWAAPVPSLDPLALLRFRLLPFMLRSSILKPNFDLKIKTNK